MAKRSLADWTAISEIIGTAAVIVSLLVLAFSVSQNTKALRATNDNFLYQIQDSIISTLVSDPSLASIYIKRENLEPLTDVEYDRFTNQGFRDLLMWELAFVRFQEGLVSDAQWNSWNNAYSIEFPAVYGDVFWSETREWVRDDFAEHVDAAYVRAE